MKPILLAAVLATVAACESTKHETRTSSAAPAPSTSETIYKIIPLKYANARELASTLRGVVVTSSGGPAPQIVPDERTNSVVVTCAQSQLASIERLIRELDIPVAKP
jgi:type II secretory pathway component HofQ